MPHAILSVDIKWCWVDMDGHGILLTNQVKTVAYQINFQFCMCLRQGFNGII